MGFQKSVAIAGAGAIALALAPLRDALTFGPDEGVEVTKAFSTEFDLELDDLSLFISGQDIGSMIGSPSIQVLGGFELTFTDLYGEVVDGRPRRLERTFDELSSDSTVSFEMMGESQEDGGEASSPLEGLSVVFAWDEESESYRTRYADDSGGDDEWLEGLTEDTDLRELLPRGDVSEGDSWSFDPEILLSVLMPGGDLAWDAEGIEDADMEEFDELFDEFSERLLEAAEELLDGEGTATYAGVRDVDGREVGAIELELEVDSSVDFADLIQELIEDAMDEAGDEVPADVEVYVETAALTVEIEAEGEMLWDLASGTPHSMGMSGDFLLVLELVVSGTAEGESQDVEATIELSGVLTSGMTTSR
jgi:hypothetical protein